MPRAPGTSTGQGHDSTLMPAIRIDADERTAALADAPWAVAWLDADGAILEANCACADLLGLDADQLPGRVLADLLDDARTVREALDATRRERERITVELKSVGAGNAAGRLVCDVVPLLERGEVAGTRWYLRPAADARAAVDLRAIGHQLRNPLASLTSGLDLLDIEGADPETVRVMRQGVEQLSRLVDDVLRQSESNNSIGSAAPAAVSPAEGFRAVTLDSTRPAPRILIVDDNPAIGRSLTLLFHSLGVREVEAALTGRDALVLLDQLRPDIVLLDIGLPDVNGYEVARTIRSTAAGRDILLVALTGYGRQKSQEPPTAASFDEHLVKPCGVEAILRLLDHPRLKQSGQRSPAGFTESTGALSKSTNTAGDSPSPEGQAGEQPYVTLQRTGEFLREVVHDARTAAFPLQIQLHLLKSQGRLEVEEIARLLSDYLAMCEKLHGVLKRAGIVLRDEFPCEFRPVELNDVIRRATDGLRSRCEAQGVELEWSSNSQPLYVNADGDSLNEAAGELLENALQATAAGGRITVRLLEHDENAVITVSDTGAGIRNETADRLMQPFDRQGRKLEPLNGHGGLGLAIARRIVERHHGRLLLRTAATGGCEAVLELPLSSRSRNPVS